MLKRHIGARENADAFIIKTIDPPMLAVLPEVLSIVRPNWGAAPR